MSVKKIATLGIALFVLSGLIFWTGSKLISGPPAPQMIVAKTNVDLGVVQGRGTIALKFDVLNSGEGTLTLSKDLDVIQNDCVHTEDRFEIAPGEVVPVVLTVHKDKLSGDFRISVPFISNDEKCPSVELVVCGSRHGTSRFSSYDRSMQARFVRE